MWYSSWERVTKRVETEECSKIERGSGLLRRKINKNRFQRVAGCMGGSDGWMGVCVGGWRDGSLGEWVDG